MREEFLLGKEKKSPSWLANSTCLLTEPTPS
jgi:hypothetical protein